MKLYDTQIVGLPQAMILPGTDKYEVLVLVILLLQFLDAFKGYKIHPVLVGPEYSLCFYRYSHFLTGSLSM